jgi:hypothetical protein
MALTLSDKTQVRSLPGSLVRPFEAAAEVDMGEAVYIDSDGKVNLCRTNVAATSQGRGIVVSANGVLPSSAGVFPAGTIVSVHLIGPIAGWSGMDEGAPIFNSAATAGAITQTAPSGAATWTNEMGYALGSDVWMVNPRVGAPTSNS